VELGLTAVARVVSASIPAAASIAGTAGKKLLSVLQERALGGPHSVSICSFGAALFCHYDGSYLLVDARYQLNFGQPTFDLTNNFLQSIGNIQLPQNARQWPSW